MKSAGVITALCALLGVLLLYLACVHYTPSGQAAIMRNIVTGEVTLDHAGWNLTPPWVQAAHVELRPMRVCITTAGRGYSCKLVRFEPEHVQEFVQVEGFRYYWWANRLSYNHGYDQEYRLPRHPARTRLWCQVLPVHHDPGNLPGIVFTSHSTPSPPSFTATAGFLFAWRSS